MGNEVNTAMPDTLDTVPSEDRIHGSSLSQKEELLEKVKAISGRGQIVEASLEDSQASKAEYFISMLGNRQIEDRLPTESSRLSALGRIVSTAIDALEEGRITEEEANSFLRYTVAGFVEREMERIVDGLFSKPDTKWFFAASQKYHEREEW
jgi:hypothetical protein